MFDSSKFVALPIRVASVAAICAALTVSLAAQTAKFTAAEVVIRSVPSDIYGIAVDANGVVYIACTSTNKVLKESPYNGGYVESSIGSGLKEPYAVALGKNGTVYIADGGNFRVLKETPQNRSYTQSTVASGFDDPTGVAVDSAGNVFVTDGPAGKVYKETLSGTTYARSTVKSGLIYPYGLAVDSSGNIYIPDTSRNRVLKEKPSGSGYIETLVGTGLKFPSGVRVDGNGNVYIADQGNQRVLKETPSGAGYTQSTVRTASSLSQNGDDIAGPNDVAVDNAGNIYIAENPGDGTYHGFVYEEFVSGLNFGSVLVGTSSVPANLGFTFQTGGTLGTVNVTSQGAGTGEFAIAGDGGSCQAGATYAAGDTCVFQIQFAPKFAGSRWGGATLTNPAGVVIASGYAFGTGHAPQVNFLPGTQTAIPYVTSGQASAYGVAVDGSGDVFIADSDNNVVRKETWTGGGYAESMVGSGLNSPTGLAIDGNGALYVADTQNNRVIKETPSATGYVQTTIGSGLNQPYGVAVDGNGNVYIADTVNERVLKETLALGAYTQSVLPASGLAYVYGVAVDGSGSVYVADTGNKRVLKLTYAADAYTQSVLDSTLDLPYGVAVDGFGNVFISDFGGNAVFRESPTPAGYAGSALNLPETENPYGVAVDAGGNLYFTDIGTEQVYKQDYADAPALSFLPTVLNTVSSDSPKAITIENIGNENLTIPVPVSGNNPSVAANFELNENAATPCPILNPASAAPETLEPNTGCELSIGFDPQAAGSLTGQVVLTDNSLKASGYTTQSLALSGNGVAASTFVAWNAPAPIVYGTALGATQLNATANDGQAAVAGTFVYTPPAGTVLHPGSNTLKVAFTPTDTAKYAGSKASQTLTVQKAQLTVTANNVSRVYGAANPALAYIISGFVNGDTAANSVTGAPTMSTSATAASATGNYSIVAAAGTLASANYTFKFVPGTLTVTRAPLTITANNDSVLYNQALPTFTYTPTGFLNGDTKAVLSGAPVETTTAAVGSLPGTYPITITQGTLVAANYTFVLKAGTLTVTPLGATATPTFTPPAGAYTTAQTVTAKDATPGAVMYYTVNGTTPTVNSTKVTGMFHVGANETIKVIAVAPGYSQSVVATAVYTIN